MRTSYRGKCFIARHEACVLVAYKDGEHFSIGYGHNDPALTASSTITFDEAWALLDEDLIPRERVIDKWLKISTRQYEHDALLSGYYQSGSRMKDVINLINDGDVPEAMALWLTYNRNKGKFSDGLAERRNQERRLFRKADYGDEAKLKLWRADPSTTPFEEIPFPLDA